MNKQHGKRVHDDWNLFYICARDKGVQKMVDTYTREHGKVDNLIALYELTVTAFYFKMFTEKGIPPKRLSLLLKKIHNLNVDLRRFEQL